MKMKNFARYATVVTTAVALMASPAEAQNLLENPNFEDGPTGGGALGWESFSNVFTEAGNGTDIVPCEGNQILKLYGGFWGSFNVSGAYQEFDTAPGEEWSMTCVARHSSLDPMVGNGAPDANWMVQKLAWFDDGGVEIGGVESTILDGTSATDACLQADTIRGTAPEGTAKVQALILYLQPNMDGGAGQIDEVVVMNETVGIQSISWGQVKMRNLQ